VAVVQELTRYGVAGFRAAIYDPNSDVRRRIHHDVLRARDQGWAVVPDHTTLREIEASIARIAAEGRLPASVRALDAQITGFAQQYLALPLERPRGVSVPVFDHTGRIVLALTAQRLPEMRRERISAMRAAHARKRRRKTKEDMSLIGAAHD